MEHEASTRLINSLQSFAREKPGLYRTRVALVAMLGYAYLLAVVVALLVFVYLCIYGMIFFHQFNFLTLKVAWIPLVLAGMVLRSMWVTIPAPDGKELGRAQAEPLFQVIEQVQKTLSGPTIHRVLLSDAFNAGIVQIPRFGMFGCTRNYLLIGLPLLSSLSPEEFRAVLAHEFGHLSGKHGRFTGWIYRVRQSWTQILARIRSERHYASFIFEWFLNWYSPYFNAYSFVLARAQEYEADRYAVELAGQQVAARMLVNMELKDRALREELWSDFYDQAADQPQPPKDSFTQILRGLTRPIADAKREKWFRHSLQIKTGYDDTHPALSDRLVHMGFKSQP
jgi:Zn-dependent protease with chaperone function